MDLLVLEIGQQVVDLLVLRHEIGPADQLLPAEFVAPVDMRKQILDIKRSLDIVQIALVNRNARETRPDDGLLDLFIGIRDGNGRNIHPGFHDLLHLGIDEADDARKHPVLLLGGRACHIDRIGQFADGNFLMVGSPLADTVSGAHQHIRQRIKNPSQHQKGPRSETGEPQRNRLRRDFRQNLPEKQQQERHDHRLEKKLETGESEKRIDDLRREDNDTDIDQVIDYQNRSQQQIGLAQQIQHPPANRRIVPPDLAHIVARKRKKSGFGAGNQRRNQ